mmetsp:Transcript_103908/g.274706  ORF Transcript_103908/g.274706 Transcript_103908/m.274706 type:complete len:247 (-) Transcript_103908:312-1052(-)
MTSSASFSLPVPAFCVSAPAMHTSAFASPGAMAQALRLVQYCVVSSPSLRAASVWLATARVRLTVRRSPAVLLDRASVTLPRDSYLWIRQCPFLPLESSQYTRTKYLPTCCPVFSTSRMISPASAGKLNSCVVKPTVRSVAGTSFLFSPIMPTPLRTCARVLPASAESSTSFTSWSGRAVMSQCRFVQLLLMLSAWPCFAARGDSQPLSAAKATANRTGKKTNVDTPSHGSITSGVETPTIITSHR